MYLVCRLLLAPPSPDISTLSLHDALPISRHLPCHREAGLGARSRVALSRAGRRQLRRAQLRFTASCASMRSTSAGARRSSPASASQLTSADRKSTRLNSSHRCISYAVFCLLLPPPISPLFPYTTLFRSLGISPVTVKRDWALARAWLYRELADVS